MTSRCHARSEPRRSIALVVAFSLGAGACSRARSEQECRADAAELGRYLSAMDHAVSPLWLGDRVRLVTRTDLAGRAETFAPAVIVSPTDVQFQGRLVAPTELPEVLAAAARARDTVGGASSQQPDARAIYLAMDQESPWAAVVGAARAAHDAGFSPILFAFARPPATPPPPRSSIDDELDAIEKGDPSRRSTEAARIIERLVARCVALQRLFGVMAMVEEDRAERLLAGIERAVVECSCEVDLPALRAALWRMLSPRPPIAVWRVDLSPTAAPIELPAATPWREASGRLRPGTGTAWLAVSGAHDGAAPDSYRRPD